MLFLSTYINKIDRKGRVSVPAPYRSALSSQAFQGIIVYNSFINPCIEACGINRIESLNNIIDNLDPYSETRDAFATTIMGSSVQLGFDGEGRVIIPEYMIQEIALEEQVCFVGKGATFEIWHPKIFEEYALRAREIAKNNRQILQFGSKNNFAGG